VSWNVYAAVYVGFAWATSATAIAFLFVAYGLHFGLAAGAQKALVAELVPESGRGRAFGLYHLCVGLCALPASALFGALYQYAGSGPAFLTGASLALAAAALLPFSLSRTKGSSPDQG
jgi:MFS family permease